MGWDAGLGEIKVEHEVGDRHLCHTPHESVDEGAGSGSSCSHGEKKDIHKDAEEKSRKMLTPPCLIDYTVQTCIVRLTISKISYSHPV